MNRRNFLKISGLALLSGGIISQINTSEIYIGNINEDHPELYNTFVAVPKISDGRIVSSSKSPLIAKKEARRKGFQNTLITYYLDPKEAQCPRVLS